MELSATSFRTCLRAGAATRNRIALLRSRAGHGAAVLLKIYAHRIDGQADAANERITDALGTQDTEQDPGDEGDGDSKQAC